MTYILAILSTLSTLVTAGEVQESDRRTFAVVAESKRQPRYSVYVQLADDLAGRAERRATVYRLADSLYLRVIPQGAVNVERGAFAYAFTLSRDPAGEARLPTTNQPTHGPAADYIRALDFRNNENTGPNELGPRNVNAAGEYREIEFAEYVLEIRVLSFEIVGLGSSRTPAFSHLSCVASVRARDG